MKYDDPSWYDQPDKNKQPSPSSDVHSQQTDEKPDVEAAETAMTTTTTRTSRRQQVFGQVIITLSFMILAFLGGWFAHQAYANSFFTTDSQSQKYASLFQQAWTLVDQNYVDRKAVNYQQMSYAAIQAMLTQLGDTGHTRFLTPQDVKSEQQQLSGTFAGIGVYIQPDAKTKNIIITSTISGAPAAKAGIKSGDIIVGVNGKSVVGQDISTVQPLIEGQTGTTVSITIKRPSTGQELTFKLVRAQIQLPNVTMHYIAEDHIADIQIAQFSTGTSDELKTAILQAKKDGATKIILDLRNNPGGYLQEAINTASEFMASGTVLIEQDSKGNQTKYNVSGQSVDTGIPMIVLVNSSTASAAEIVSGALQDNGRALIMGTTTYGTGTVLQEYDLSDGSAILLGIDEWLTPKGHFIRKEGITPNIKVPMDTSSPILTPDVANQNNLTLAQIMASGDTQLIAAINYLTSH